MREKPPVDSLGKSGEEPSNGEGSDRRSFLSGAGSLAMACGLTASYGTLAVMAGQFLYPSSDSPKGWMFLTDMARLQPGESFTYRAPSGQTIAVARVANKGEASDFLALSSVCPHLGCQVHWEAQNSRFFCPCHNGTFDSSGKATGGPPAAAGQSLRRYPLKVERGLLFIEVPTAKTVASQCPAPQEDAAPRIQELELKGVC